MVERADPLAADYSVQSVGDLIVVITRLRSDLAENPDGWENPTLDRFLEAMAAWLSAFPQSYVNCGQDVPKPDWRFVADVLRAARVYEWRTPTSDRYAVGNGPAEPF